MSPSLLPHDVPEKFRTAVRYLAETGNSGAGVFHATEKCLIGIISRRISGNRVSTVNGEAIKKQLDIAKYFVPVSELAKFIPPTCTSDLGRSLCCRMLWPKTLPALAQSRHPLPVP